jgi:hypothetical protein
MARCTLLAFVRRRPWGAAAGLLAIHVQPPCCLSLLRAASSARLQCVPDCSKFGDACKKCSIKQCYKCKWGYFLGYESDDTGFKHNYPQSSPAPNKKSRSASPAPRSTARTVWPAMPTSASK